MAANKVAMVFILCILLFAISHTTDAWAKGDKCENDCLKLCGVDESSWSPCPLMCTLTNCGTNYNSPMAVQSPAGGRKFTKPASAPSGSMASSKF